MKSYKLTERAFVNDTQYERGDIVTVADDFVPGPHMVPVDQDTSSTTADPAPAPVEPEAAPSKGKK